MDAYPGDYIDHNLPLVLVSGLADDQHDAQTSEGSTLLLQEGGFRLRIDLPVLRGDVPAKLLQTLLSHDSTHVPWNGKYISQTENKTCFHMRSIGRFFTLPPRKAPPPPHSPRLLPGGGGANPPAPMILHSALSPLTPSSPLYADGIMTSLWIAKHQSRLPSVFIAVFSLSADSNTSTLLDNKIKSEITNIRSVFTSANYKTKLVIVLVGEDGLTISDIEERVAIIRRATSLDSKNSFALSGSSTHAEIADFVTGMLNAVYPVSIEYYRDLSKHARRKRNRNSIPQPTVLPPSGSHMLSLQAWNLRYEFKLAIFAEFRQEMDAALRNYETAYESLLSTDVFGVIPAWSPRFDEARLLADITSIRIIRCLLWTGQTTSAVKWWSKHRDNIRALIARSKNGTETYTWETWRSLWARTMSDLISRTQIFPSTDFNEVDSVEKSILVHSEKTLATNVKFAPWESLHHEGYWQNLAQRHTRARRSRAQRIPDEDRAPPGQSPASSMASRAHMYDSYMCLEPHREYPVDDQPGFDYTREIVNTLDTATQHFSRHSQIRMIQVLQLQKAMELIRSAHWDDAVSVLVPLWQDPILRKAGWWLILKEISRALWTCAIKSKNHQLLIQISWERVHPLLILGGETYTELVDAIKSGEAEASTETRLNVRDCLSNVSARFAFAAAECHVGQSVDVQITLQHLPGVDRSVVRIRSIQVAFNELLIPILITDDGLDDQQRADADSDSNSILDLALNPNEHSGSTTETTDVKNSPTASSVAIANLSLQRGTYKILQLQVSPLQPGDISVSSVTLELSAGDQNLSIVTSEEELASEVWWESRGERAISRRYGKDREVATLKVLPKPPKLEIEVTELQKVYYTNEDIDLVVRFTNLEEAVINGTVDVRLISPNKNSANIKWKEQDQISAIVADSDELIQALSQKQLSDLSVGKDAAFAIILDTMGEALDHELEIAVTYSFPSSPLTLLHKQFTIDLAIVRPFEANFGFHSRLHKEAWPCFFSADSISRHQSRSSGLKQQFLVSALVCSFAAEDLIIKEARLVSSKTLGDATCTTSKGHLQGMDQGTLPNSIPIQREQNRRFNFDMTLQKHTLGDRQPVAVDLHLEVVWKRATTTTETYHTSTLPVPRFLAPSAEPRVLLQIMPPSTHPTYSLTYTLENPSLHFLTFNLTMESSEDFAFSGPKTDSISLVPISRNSVQYQIIPTGSGSKKDEFTDKEGVEWMRVNLDVVDAYFGQTLRIQPASDGVKVDKQGNVLLRMY